MLYHIIIWYYIMLYSMKHRSVPKKRCPQCLSPVQTPGGHPSNSINKHSWAHMKTPRGQTLSSPRPKVPSVPTRVISF